MKFIIVSTFFVFIVNSASGQSVDCYTFFEQKGLLTAYSKKIFICHPTINDSNIDIWQLFITDILKERKATTQVGAIKLCASLPFSVDSSVLSQIQQYTNPAPLRKVWCIIPFSVKSDSAILLLAECKRSNICSLMNLLSNITQQEKEISNMHPTKKDINKVLRSTKKKLRLKSVFFFFNGKIDAA